MLKHHQQEIKFHRAFQIVYFQRICLAVAAKPSIVLLVLQICNSLSINIIATLSYRTVDLTQYVTWADSDPEKGRVLLRIMFQEFSLTDDTSPEIAIAKMKLCVASIGQWMEINMLKSKQASSS